MCNIAITAGDWQTFTIFIQLFIYLSNIYLFIQFIVHNIYPILTLRHPCLIQIINSNSVLLIVKQSCSRASFVAQVLLHVSLSGEHLIRFVMNVF